MTDVVRPVTPAKVPCRPRVGGVAAGWAVGYTAFGASVALAGVPALYHGPHPWPPGADWLIVAAAAPAALATIAARHRRAATTGRVLPPLLLILCLPLAALAFGLLMTLITLVFAQTVDSWVAAANQALAATGAVLLAVTAHRCRHAARGTCPRCGAAHDRAARPARPRPSAAPTWVRRLAWAAAGAFLPYTAMKTTWAFGGTFAGLRGAQVRQDFAQGGASGLTLTLESWGIDVTALLAVLGLVLLFALTRPFGQVYPRWVPLLGGRGVPRWLPLVPACTGAATLAPYGLAGLAYCALGTAGAVTIPRGQFPTPGDALLVCWCGLGAFAVFGVALAAAAWSYLRRTRPVCLPVPAPAGTATPGQRPGPVGSTKPDS